VRDGGDRIAAAALLCIHWSAVEFLSDLGRGDVGLFAGDYRAGGYREAGRITDILPTKRHALARSGGGGGAYGHGWSCRAGDTEHRPGSRCLVAAVVLDDGIDGPCDYAYDFAVVGIAEGCRALRQRPNFSFRWWGIRIEHETAAINSVSLRGAMN